MRVFLFFLMLITNHHLVSQKRFDNTIEFNDGIYLTIEEFVNNKPSVKFQDVELNISEETFDTEHAKTIEILKDNLIFNPRVWGICLDGVPYIRLATIRTDSLDRLEKRFIKEDVFSKFLVIGNLCAFSLPIYIASNKNMSVFFGVAGGLSSVTKSNSPSKKTSNVSDGTKTKWYFLSLKEDKACQLELEPFFNHIKSDIELADEVWKDYYAPKKLIFYLNKYNERNPYYIEQ